jgi:hypothetical protein
VIEVSVQVIGQALNGRQRDKRVGLHNGPLRLLR